MNESNSIIKNIVNIVAWVFSSLFLFCGLLVIIWFNSSALAWGAWGDFLSAVLLAGLVFVVSLLIFSIFQKLTSTRFIWIGYLFTLVVSCILMRIYFYEEILDSLITAVIVAFSFKFIRQISTADTEGNQINLATVFITGILLLILIIFGAKSIQIIDRKQAQESFKNYIEFGNISDANGSITNVSDEIFYSINNNPVGVIFKYSVNTGNDDVSLYRGRDEFSTWIRQNSMNNLGELESIKVDIHPDVAGEPYLKKNQTYEVTVYALPISYYNKQDLEVSNNRVGSLEAGCLNLYPEDIQELESGPIIDFYSINLLRWRFISKNQYDTRIFYQSMMKEGIEKCVW